MLLHTSVEGYRSEFPHLFSPIPEHFKRFLTLGAVAVVPSNPKRQKRQKNWTCLPPTWFVFPHLT